MSTYVQKIGSEYWISVIDLYNNILECSDTDLSNMISNFNLKFKKSNICLFKDEEDNVFMGGEDLVRLLKFIIDCDKRVSRTIKNYLSDLEKIVCITKRKYNVSHRIHIAWTQEYKCGKCKCFPIPPAFQIDHRVPLHEGGPDILDNLWALCPNCHAEKSRREQLKKHHLFRDINFDNTNTSKYFNNGKTFAEYEWSSSDKNI